MVTPNGKPVCACHKEFMHSLVFLLTRRCPLTCAHCITRSGPDEPDELSTETVVDWVTRFAQDGRVQAMAFTGGEPFLKEERLSSIVSVTSEYGLTTEVISSCYWATSPARARKKLAKFPGITHFTASADVFHIPFVSLQCVRNAVDAALSLGKKVSVSLCLRDEEDEFEAQFKEIMGQTLASITLVRQWLHGAGRGVTQAHLIEQVAFDQVKDEGCQNATTPSVLPDGTVMACCGDTLTDAAPWESTLRLGNLHVDSVQDIFERADRSVFVHAMRLWGPKGITELVRHEFPEKFAGMYEKRNYCDLCRQISSDPEIRRSIQRRLAEPDVIDAVAVLRATEYGELSSLGT